MTVLILLRRLCRPSACPRAPASLVQFSCAQQGVCITTRTIRHQLLASSVAKSPSFRPVFFRLSSTSTQTAEAQAPLEKPDFLDPSESKIWDILSREFSPTGLSVRDISGGCGSMYGIEVASHKFRGISILKQQRMVNAALGEMVKEWHGIQLQTRAS
jgi:BolA-like protein 3